MSGGERVNNNTGDPIKKAGTAIVDWYVQKPLTSDQENVLRDRQLGWFPDKADNVHKTE